MKPESHINYIRPEDSSLEEEFRHHRFEVKAGDEIVSVAEVHYFSRPIPFYQVTSLHTENEHQGNGYAAKVMDQIEAFLKERNKPGILADSSGSNMDSGESYYASRGWTEIGGEGHRVFNLPDDVDSKIFAGYYLRGVDVSGDSD